MFPILLTPKVAKRLDRAWLILCLLAAMSGLVVFTPLWWMMPSILRAVLVVPGLFVTLLIVVASCEPSTQSLPSRAGSTRR